MGTWQEDTVPPRFKRANAIGVQESQRQWHNAIVRQTPFCSATNFGTPNFGRTLGAQFLIVPILVRQRLNCRGTEPHQGHQGYVNILVNTQIYHSLQLKVKVQWKNKNTKPRKRKNTLTNEKNTENFLQTQKWFCVHFGTC